MKPAFVVINSASGSYSLKRTDRILALLRKSGIAPQPLHPGSEEEAKATVRSLCRSEQRPLIIAVGGDGTVNAVVNGMEPQSATLGVIPLGTANVLARELGITSERDAIARIAAGMGRSFSVGKVETACGERRFLLMAGIGIDGAIVAGMRSGEKRWFGKLAYLLSTIRQLPAWDRTALMVSDGVRNIACHTVVIANAAHYGGPYILAPESDIFKPNFSVVPLATFTRLGFARFALAMILTGRAPRSPETWQFGSGRLTIVGDKAIQIDGDYFGTGSAELSIIPDFNEMLV